MGSSIFGPTFQIQKKLPAPKIRRLITYTPLKRDATVLKKDLDSRMLDLSHTWQNYGSEFNNDGRRKSIRVRNRITKV
jgi:hypothetical protein